MVPNATRDATFEKIWYLLCFFASFTSRNGYHSKGWSNVFQIFSFQLKIECILSTTYTDLNSGRVFHAYDHSMFYPIQLALQHSMQVAAQSGIFCIVELLRVVIARSSNLNNIFPDDSVHDRNRQYFPSKQRTSLTYVIPPPFHE